MTSLDRKDERDCVHRNYISTKAQLRRELDDENLIYVKRSLPFRDRYHRQFRRNYPFRYPKNIFRRYRELCPALPIRPFSTEGIPELY
eukprot:gene8227-16915_t